MASNLRLVLRDGTVLTPDSCVGQNITTRDIVALDSSSSIKIGDSANQYIYVKMTFTILQDMWMPRHFLWTPPPWPMAFIP